MYRFAALGLIASSLIAGPACVRAEEGRVAQPVVAPDSNRASTYTRSSAPQSAAIKTLRHTQTKPGGGSVREKRGATTMAARSDNFYIYDARSSLRGDRDGDGYHGEFRVGFDADVLIGDALVYARLYLRRSGENEWYLYHQTEDFWIYGQSGEDDYYVTTTLDAGYATGEYDVLIDIYESGYSGIVASLGPLESGALNYLPLEEVGLDVPIDLPGYSIGEVFIDLIADDDGDGHYSRFRITFDPDADVESRRVFARVWVRARGGEWIEEFVSEDWWVETSGASDTYVLDVDWISGYPTASYDVQIDLYDAANELLIASAGSERADLAQIPLEDRTLDLAANPPTAGGGGESHSREGGGGALGIASILGLLALASARRRWC